jgi:hypothetical protein
MLKIIKSLIVLLIIIIVLFIVIGIILPEDYLLSRSVVIDASPQQIHPYLNNLNNWPEWSPWTENDPTLKVTVGDIYSGVGASQSWVSKDGDGSLVFTASNPQNGIDYDLEFNQGQFQCKSGFKYVPEGQNTQVIWEMTGTVDTPVIGGYFAAKMDSWVGKEFEKGLQNLKKVVENKN